MAATLKPTFGKKPVVDAGATGVRRGASVPSHNVIYRDGETPQPAFHNSHIEMHWPKYGGVVVALGTCALYIEQSRLTLATLVVIPLIFGFTVYLGLQGIRRAAVSLHRLRTEASRSPAYVAGAAVGLLYVLYSTFLSPGSFLGIEWGPRPNFADGLQRTDVASSAILLLKAFGMMALSGWLFQFIAKRFRGQQSGAGQDAR